MLRREGSLNAVTQACTASTGAEVLPAFWVYTRITREQYDIPWNKCPVMLDVTDGQVHNLMLVDDMELYVWEALTPKQAYFEQAEHLKAMIQYFGKTLERLRRMPLAYLPDTQQSLMERLKALQPPNVPLPEQLDSVVPHMPEHQKIQCAYDIIMAKQRGTSSPVSANLSETLS